MERRPLLSNCQPCRLSDEFTISGYLSALRPKQTSQTTVCTPTTQTFEKSSESAKLSMLDIKHRTICHLTKRPGAIVATETSSATSCSKKASQVASTCPPADVISLGKSEVSRKKKIIKQQLQIVDEYRKRDVDVVPDA